ncbi:MAG: hypothetical protein O7G85_02615 [Planctomycetota bacterium]|nr:hypothetical protein [Planctomycetota bacterium]
MNPRHNNFYTHECRSIGVPLRVSTLLGLLLAFLITPSSQAQCQYEAILLEGPLCSGGNPAGITPQGLDANGNTVGSSSCFFNFFASMVRADGTASWLTPPPNSGESKGIAILDPDHVVGRAVPTGAPIGIAAIWEFGQGRFLNMLPNTDAGVASGMNSSGQIVGLNYDSIFGPRQAVLWEGDQPIALDLPVERNGNSSANDINEQGQITGWMGGAPSTDSQAFIWDNGVVLDLGAIPGGTTAEGMAINNLGHVTGRGHIPDGVTEFGSKHAFFWDGQTMIRLPELPDTVESLPNDINDADQIVGQSLVDDGVFAKYFTLWQDGQVYNLDDLIVTNLSNVTNSNAYAINNDGQILVHAGSESYLLNPIDSPPGDTDNNCVVDVDDLLCVLTEWGNTISIADVDDDGIVDVLDLLQVLADWG